MTQKFTNKLSEIGQSLAASPAALALLGLGSAGVERNRLDSYSDIDFFVIVQPGWKQHYLQKTEWLETKSGIDWIFQNTTDGFKIYWQDDVFGEMAVFEPNELANIQFSTGVVLWSTPDFDVRITEPKNLPVKKVTDPQQLKNELLSNLFVGISRFRRGEEMSAWRFVQVYALTLAIEIEINSANQAADIQIDVFDLDRRLELNFPEISSLTKKVLLGISETPAATQVLLDWLLDSGFSRNKLTERVQELIDLNPTSTTNGV
jgi:lincosamide nucleotidyltransferase B/F